MFYALDTSMHRGQLYQIRIFSETSFWESEKTDYVNLTSGTYYIGYNGVKLNVVIVIDVSNKSKTFTIVRKIRNKRQFGIFS